MLENSIKDITAKEDGMATEAMDETRHTFANVQTIDTIKALIDLYKREFGPEWQSAFISTVGAVYTGDRSKFDELSSRMQ